MKLFGSLSEIVSAIFRRSSPNNTITVQPGSSTANAGNVVVELPPKTTGTSTLVDTDTAQSIDSKTLNSPTLVTPALGTPASGVMTNVTGLPLTTGTTGVLPADKGGTGISNNAAATTTRVGAFAKTETLTAPTSVTYPTAGTLATRAGSEPLQNKTIDNTNSISVKETSFAIEDATDSSTRLVFGAGGTTNTKTTLAASQTVDRNINLPNADDTLVGKNTADILTQKSISGSANTLTNIPLTSAVTGILPLVNGGTGTSTVSSGVVRSNGSVLSGAGTVSLTAEVTGTLPLANGGTNATTKAGAFDSLSPMTTAGDVIYGGASGTGTRLAAGTSTQILHGGTTPSWSAVSLTADVSGALPLLNGGTGTAAASANAAFNALSPMTTAGDLIYGGASGAGTRLGVGSSGQVLTVSGGNPAWSDASAGAGELNEVTNPSAASTTTGWTNGTSHTGSRVTSGSPLDPLVTTAFSIATSAAATESSTSGFYYPFTLATGLKSKRLKVEFYVTVPSADVWRLSVYQGTTRLSLSTDSSSVTTLPAGFTGKFTAYFDTTTATAYSVNFTKTTRAGSGNDLTFTNLIVGPGIQPQGAVSTDWVSYTPTVAGMGSGTATATAKWRRVGNTMQIKQYTTVSVNGTGSTTVSWSLPSGTTVDTSALPNNAFTNNIRNALGQSLVFDSSTGGIALQEVITNDSTTVQIIKTGSTGTYTGADLGTTKTVSFDITVPISEWAGSGIQALAQNNIEYLTNTNTSTSASDTTTFAYSQAGTAFVSVASAGATIKKRVRAQGVFSSGGGKPKLEVSPDGVLWLQAETKFAYLESGSQKYGMRLVAGGTAATDVDVEFGGDGANGTEAWSVYTAWKWRVVVEQPGQAVGFGNVAQSQSGLVQSAGQLLGTNTNDNAATNNVGEYLENNRSSATPTLTVANTAQSWSVDTGNSTFNDAGEVGITLGAGDWDISGIVNFNLAASTILSDASAWIGTAKGNSTTGQVISKNYNRLNATIATSGFVTLVVPTWRVSISTATTYYLKATATISVSTLTATGNIRARRMR